MSNINQRNGNLSKAIQKLYLDGSTVFDSGDGKRERIPSHKVLLVASSGVFKALFNGPWKEQNEIQIDHASAAAFKDFLQFFYIKKVKLASKNVEELTNLGERYKINACLHACAHYFSQRRLTHENVCIAYGLSIMAD